MSSDAPREHDLCDYLMQDIFTDVKLPEEFLLELAKRFHEDGLIDVLGSTLNHIAEEIASIKFNSNSRSVAIRVPLLSSPTKLINFGGLGHHNAPPSQTNRNGCP